MSECYLIPVGGTGIRVMKSIVNLCMAGCFEQNDKFKVMCIDSDGTNGNVVELNDLLRNYRAVGNNLFPEIELNVIDGKESIVWSPLSGGEDKDKQSNMNEMTFQSAMSKDAQQVFELLYTAAERDKKLEGGFYGHTSIGSYFMAQEVVKDGKFTKVWSDFFGGNGEDNKNANVFILGSVFGGTGASGVPTIAKLIKDQYPTANIGALLVMPYFNPQREDDGDISQKLAIDGGSFTAKTKTALTFYNKQNFKDVFNNMYFIGEKNGFLKVGYHDYGKNQKNKATPMEVFAATALLDFLKLSKKGENSSEEGKIMIFWRQVKDGENPDVITQEMLDFNEKNIFDDMCDFLRFSMLYTKYLYPCIKQNYPKFVERYNGTSLKNYSSLNEACIEYIKWTTELILENDGNGNLNYNKENGNVRWFNYKGCESLYNCKELNSKPRKVKVGGIFSQKEFKKDFDITELEKMNAIIKSDSDKKADGNLIIRRFLTYNSGKKEKTITSLCKDVKDIIKKCDNY